MNQEERLQIVEALKGSRRNLAIHLIIEWHNQNIIGVKELQELTDRLYEPTIQLNTDELDLILAALNFTRLSDVFQKHLKEEGHPETARAANEYLVPLMDKVQKSLHDELDRQFPFPSW
jgi:hypothetical protein